MKPLFTYFCYGCESYYHLQINHLCETKKPKNLFFFLSSHDTHGFFYGHKKNEMLERNWYEEFGYYLTHYQIIQNKLFTQGITIVSRGYQFLQIWRNSIMARVDDFKSWQKRYTICEFTKKEKKIRLLKEILPLSVDMYSIVLDYVGVYTIKTFKIPQSAHFMKHKQWIFFCKVMLSTTNYLQDKLHFTILNYLTKQRVTHTYSYLEFEKINHKGLCHPDFSLYVNILISTNTISKKEFFIIWDLCDKSLFVLPVTFYKQEQKWIFHASEKITLPFSKMNHFHIEYCYEEKPYFKFVLDKDMYLAKLQRDSFTQRLNIIIVRKLETDDRRRALLRLYSNCEY